MARPIQRLSIASFVLPCEKLFCIDPGKHHFGWAVFHGPRRTLLEAGDWPTWEGGLEGLATCAIGQPQVKVLCEYPQVYAPRHSKGDPNDLLALAETIGALRYIFRRAAVWETTSPHAWKGTVPKHVFLRRIQSRLDENEVKVITWADAPALRVGDMIDAIGLGLWKLGRLKGVKNGWIN